MGIHTFFKHKAHDTRSIIFIESLRQLACGSELAAILLLDGRDPSEHRGNSRSHALTENGCNSTIAAILLGTKWTESVQDMPRNYDIRTNGGACNDSF